MRHLLLGVTVIALGCTSTMTPEEIAWNRQIDIDNWNLCYAIMTHRGIAINHVDHSIRHRRPSRWDISNDLKYNHCRERLGRRYWILK